MFPIKCELDRLFHFESRHRNGFGSWNGGGHVKMVKSGALTLTAMVRFGIGFTAGGFWI